MKTKSSIILAILAIALTPFSALSNQQTSYLDSDTLPSHLSDRAYSQHIADLLGWLPNHDPNQLCRGTYFVPHDIEDHPNLDDRSPIHIRAEGPEILKLNGVSELKKNVVITQPGRIIYADKVFIFRNEKTKKVVKIELLGHVKIYQQYSMTAADYAMITLYPKTTKIQNAAYHYRKQDVNAWGTAKRGRQTAEHVSILENATYSICKPIHPAWTISAKKIVLDKPNNVGKAYHAVLRLFSVPLFYFPYYSFQLNNERKSGFLTPQLGHVGDAGPYVGFPYYFNLAPNYDLLVTPESFGQRGFRTTAKFRYLTKRSNGFLYGSFLANDPIFQTFRQNAINTYSNTSSYNSNTYSPYINQLKSASNQRGQFSANNTAAFNTHWSTRTNINWVSDPYYINNTAATRGIDLATTNQLLNLIQLQYSNSFWDVNSAVQAYQTLHLIDQIQSTSQPLDQYTRLPDLNAAGYFPISENSALQLDSDYTNFTYSSLFQPPHPQGQRLHLRPGWTYDFEEAGGYIKPQVWADLVGYDLYQTIPGIPHTSGRVLPIVDIDSGIHFTRDFQINDKSYLQTLEPRLFYLYVPYTNQNQLPNFDTIQLPFFFDQLFALNAFQSVDRLENANQLSLGMSSNIIAATSGATILSANLGEIYYIDQPRICLTDLCHLTTPHFSPLVANVAFNPNATWSVGSSIAWEPKNQLFDNGNLSLTYHEDNRHIFNLSYLYVGANPGAVPTFSASQLSATAPYANASYYISSYVAWPLVRQWTFIGNTFYDLELKRFNNLLGGIEYDTCCWSIRFIINRILGGSTTTSTGGLQNYFNTSYFIEFTLKGLASFGTVTSFEAGSNNHYLVGEHANNYVQGFVPGYK
ncbi:MAG: hypothetical protein A3F10_02895 [Coxiella sp. RIFCSPHIGHO2_12_FULL_42_15]|nr:MAG: hypothetical protein A3F10_02895 [Coxiella sp. RIFCSPHIGHO2_12_FULL_42_15]